LLGTYTTPAWSPEVARTTSARLPVGSTSQFVSPGYVRFSSSAARAGLKPSFPKSHGRPRVDDRRVLSGIIFVNRNGLRWRDAPKQYGPAKTLYNRWKRRGDKGIFIQMMESLGCA